MRFLADMGISPNTVAFLRAQGHDAIHLLEVELERLTDPAILEKALQEECILLTHDLDFGELLAASKAQLPSVIIFRLQNMRQHPCGRFSRACRRAYGGRGDQRDREATPRKAIADRGRVRELLAPGRQRE